jgi:GNAT superfamily N-acetyltransferase
MTLTWKRESRPVWDADKQRVIGGAPPGVFDLPYAPGVELPGDWWSADDGTGPVGYGWLDATWGGDAEILLAVDAQSQGKGVGGFILQHLEQEAAHRGLNYVYNTVRSSHPDRQQVYDWLTSRGYRGSENDSTLRKRTREETTPQRQHHRSRSGAPPAAFALQDALAPGHEESGAYVNLEDHHY